MRCLRSWSAGPHGTSPPEESRSRASAWTSHNTGRHRECNSPASGRKGKSFPRAGGNQVNPSQPAGKTRTCSLTKSRRVTSSFNSLRASREFALGPRLKLGRVGQLFEAAPVLLTPLSGSEQVGGIVFIGDTRNSFAKIAPSNRAPCFSPLSLRVGRQRPGRRCFQSRSVILSGGRRFGRDHDGNQDRKSCLTAWHGKPRPSC